MTAISAVRSSRSCGKLGRGAAVSFHKPKELGFAASEKSFTGDLTRKLSRDARCPSVKIEGSVQATAGAQCRQDTDGVKEGGRFASAQMLAVVFERLLAGFNIVWPLDS
jgi:hypothetical protein